VALAPPVPPKPAPRSDCPTEYPPGKKPMVVFVVDASGSMRESIPGGSSRMQAAKDAVAQVVGGLAPPVELGLIDFADCERVNNQGRYYYDDRPRMLGQVQGLSPQRGTPLGASIKRAGDMMTTRGGREATIVVVTDGDDTCPGRGDPCEIARQVRQEKPNVTINVIDVSGGAGTATARCIASAGGGKVLTPNSAMDMKTKMQQATRLPDTRTCKP
jgi:Mg-chelatase subunit ChlD